MAAGTAPQRGDFVGGIYEARIRRNPDRIQVQLLREGTACGVPLRITKGLTLDAGSSTLQVAYLLENLPAGPAAALRRRDELRRHAGQRLRAELLRHRRQRCWANSARSSI